MKYLFIITLTFACTSFACKVREKPNGISGTYELVSKTIKKGDDVYGYAGDIQIKELPTNKIVFSSFITKGAPSYNLSSFVDTLDFSNNLAVYKLNEDSIRCQITFLFNEKGIKC